MTKTIDLAQQPTLAELLALTAAGNAVVIVQSGTPIATLTPADLPSAEAGKQRTPNLQPKAFTQVSEDFDAPLPNDFWLSGER